MEFFSNNILLCNKCGEHVVICYIMQLGDFVSRQRFLKNITFSTAMTMTCVLDIIRWLVVWQFNEPKTEKHKDIKTLRYMVLKCQRWYNGVLFVLVCVWLGNVGHNFPACGSYDMIIQCIDLKLLSTDGSIIFSNCDPHFRHVVKSLYIYITKPC